MKKNLLIISSIICALLFSTNIFAQVLFEENFDYPAGDTLTNHGWENHSGSGTFITIFSGSLTYPGYPSSGNSVKLTMGGGSREDVHVNLPSPITTGSVYATILVRVDSAALEGTYFYHLADSFPTFTFRARLFARADSSGNLMFGISKGSSSTVAWTTTPYNFGQTYLLVLKYEIVGDVAGTDDVVKLYINPDVSQPEPGSPDLTNIDGTSSDSRIGGVAMRQGFVSGEASLQVDGIRVGTNWSETVPVELTSFAASVSGNSVTLNWTTATELNNSGFDILRQTQNNQWNKIGFVAGFGTSTEMHSYSFVDENLASGSYAYRLKQVDYDGTFELSDVVNVEVINPDKYSLSQNYPNPFNPSTTIKFALAKSGNVTLKIYNTLGQEVALLVNQFMESGVHEVNFNALNLNSGMYFYRIEAGDFSQVKKMTLLK